MKLICEGLVIWQTKSGDASRVITLLTRDGVVVAFAKNSLRPNNKLATATSFLTYSDFELFSGNRMYNVDEAVCKTRFVALSANVEGLALASYLCELARELAPVNDDASGYLSLMLNSLHLINEGDRPLALIKAVFELCCMSLSGYLPELFYCGECGELVEGVCGFDALAGHVYCAECCKKSHKLVNCGAPVLAAMRHIVSSEPKGAFSFSLADKALTNLSILAESYVLQQFERMPATLEYYKKICG